MTCCCRCKESSPNTSEQRSWSGADEAKSMLQTADRSTSCPTRHSDTATCRFGKAEVRPGSNRWLSRHELFNRSFPGSDATAAAWPRCAVGCRKRAKLLQLESESGPAKPAGTFFRTRRIKVEPPMERRT